MTVSTAIDANVAERAMLKHPFYQAWTEGRLPLDTLRAYARQYFHHVEAFPRAVSAVHSACEDRDGRRMLAENLAEEEGIEAGKQDHATLWMMFACGLGEAGCRPRAGAQSRDPGADRHVQQAVAALVCVGPWRALRLRKPVPRRSPARRSKGWSSVTASMLRKRCASSACTRARTSSIVTSAAPARPLAEDERDEAIGAGEELAGALWNFLSGVEARAAIN